MKKLIKELLLELKIDILDHYPYEINNMFYMFNDKEKNRNILNYKILEDNGIIIKFGVDRRGVKKIDPGIQTRIRDNKVFNTYLYILFNELLPKFNYIKYAPMNEDRTYDERRARLYKIGIEKYLNQKKWKLKKVGEEWIIIKNPTY